MLYHDLQFIVKFQHISFLTPAQFFTWTSIICFSLFILMSVLDQMMRNPSKSLSKHVDDVIAAVCDEKRYQVSEYNPSVMLKVCKFIKGRAFVCLFCIFYPALCTILPFHRSLSLPVQGSVGGCEVKTPTLRLALSVDSIPFLNGWVLENSTLPKITFLWKGYIK